MSGRRKFIRNSILGGVSIIGIPGVKAKGNLKTKYSKPLSYKLTHDIPAKFYDGRNCWVHPRAGIVPGTGRKDFPRVVFTMTTQDNLGSDVFKDMYGFHTNDLGTSWSTPEQVISMRPRFEELDGVKCPIAASDFWPAYHRESKTLLGIGHTVVYTPDWHVKFPRPRNSVFSIYNSEQDKWSEWKIINLPDKEKFYHEGAGSVQRYDEADGTILLPTYFTPLNEVSSRVAVMKYAFDGEKLQYLIHGNELSIDDKTRGLHEPSLTKFNNEYFMTIRNDNCGFVTRSKDGLEYEPINLWKFDDGTDLGNYNTQQHWVTHSDGLFLVYTRRGANNDHVTRHRAPLFMAQVDTDRLCIIRDTEQIIVPERGAKLGNFGVTAISPEETWVTVSEWMQPIGVEKYGSDGSIWVARIHWNKPNLYFQH